MRLALFASLFLHGGLAMLAARGMRTATSDARDVLENGVVTTISWAATREVPRFERITVAEPTPAGIPVPAAAVMDATAADAVAEIAAELQATLTAPADTASLGITPRAPDTMPTLPPDDDDIEPTRLCHRVPAASPQAPSATPPPPASMAAVAAVQPPTPRILTQAPGTNAPPVYPPAAKRRGQQGTVAVHFICDELGRVTGAEVFRSSGFPLLDEAALTAVRSWRFHGGPGHGEQLVEFRLDGASSRKVATQQTP